MKQKIEVQVTAAADEQWPRLIGKSDPFPIEMRVFIPIRRDTITLCGENCVLDEMDLPYFLTEYVGMQICFKNFASAAAWWTNPQPVKPDPEAVELWKIPANSFFIHHGELYRDTDISDGNGHCSVYHQGDGKIVEMSSETMVIPFYGTITINVGRDAE